MTLETFFLVLVPTYLALVAYGQVGSRRRGLLARMRLVTGALRIALPPIAVMLALLSTRDAFLIARWGAVTAGMAIAGIAVALLTEFVARRIGA